MNEGHLARAVALSVLLAVAPVVSAAESAAAAADGRLQVIDLYANDPAGSARAYEHVEGDTFRRRRKDEALGETLVFERDGGGAVVALLTDGYRYFRQ